VALGPAVIKQIHERMVEIARDERIVAGRRMRIDTTVVEANIHYPTDSSLDARSRNCFLRRKVARLSQVQIQLRGIPDYATLPARYSPTTLPSNQDA
jgi:hypothetical protein